MTEQFFENPILNSPYATQDGTGNSNPMVSRRTAIFDSPPSDLITPVPKPKKRKKPSGQTVDALRCSAAMTFRRRSSEYNPTPIINEVRGYVETWRKLPNPDQWQVTPETARLLQHWRHHTSQGIRPFFCQVEAVETAIWLTEVAPKMGRARRKVLDHLKAANEQANPNCSASR